MAHDGANKDDDQSLDNIKITVEGDDGDAVNMSWHEFAALLAGFAGEPLRMRLACGDEFELPGEALAAMTDMRDRERRGWDARFNNAASAEVARRLVDQLLALGCAPPTLNHIATTQGIWGEMFRELFARAEVDLE
ncbi:MAG: hypothetical protein ACREHD_27855, partial [Pirellulales bacterium]